PPGRDGAGWIAMLVAALTGAATGRAADDGMPFDRPLGAGLCLVALRGADAAAAGARSLAELGLSPDAADRATRRHRADTEGIPVPADLVERIVNA
ncbi:hypothetical protein HKCCE2091_21255, partial [Rhodobacterales bacterium HKCCE2091]|nr:hypothetical protein [Rhodobacterales bacterium HKCCE2091]